MDNQTNSISAGTITTTGVNIPKRWNFCPQCGEHIQGGWNFCGQCGERVCQAHDWSIIYVPASTPIQTQPIWQSPNPPNTTFSIPSITCVATSGFSQSRAS